MSASKVSISPPDASQTAVLGGGCGRAFFPMVWWVEGNRVGFESGAGLSTGDGARWEDLFLGGLLEGVELFGDFVGDELF